jgi:hypothetical protein
MMGPASNTRQKDETRRYDGSDYELTPLTRDDYREMAEAGINCVRVSPEQAPWANELGLYYWGPLAHLPYPELLYRSQYLGPVLYLDEPAVGARDYALRPRLEKDAAFRKSVSPQAALEMFRARFAQALAHASTAMGKALAARPDVDAGSMSIVQENLYSWETVVSTAAYQLSQHPRVPEAMVFEPPGRIGTRRTIPEIDMTYGAQIPADNPKALPSIIFGFLRGAARATGKNWGVSIYGAVQHADTFFWLTYAYDLAPRAFTSGITISLPPFPTPNTLPWPGTCDCMPTATLPATCRGCGAPPRPSSSCRPATTWDTYSWARDRSGVSVS